MVQSNNQLTERRRGGNRNLNMTFRSKLLVALGASALVLSPVSGVAASRVGGAPVTGDTLFLGPGLIATAVVVSGVLIWVVTRSN